ncbi:MAG: short-chain fatty acyl-CoA regulator family protein [Rubricella sp.]
MAGSFAGLRIRERRRLLGISQTELARRAGISASYLNLIEHNKRTIGGRVLEALARELDLPPSALSRETELSVIGELRAAADDIPDTGAELDRTEEFVSRYPGWARLLTTLNEQNARQRATLDLLSDRLAHDPVLQDTLHEVLTRVTAVHSTAGILSAEAESLPADQAQRFIKSLDTESARLARVAETLTRYFDRVEASDQPGRLPGEELDAFLLKRHNRFPELETIEPGRDPADTIGAILTAPDAPHTPAGRAEARRHLERYAADAAVLPEPTFSRFAEGARYDPTRIAMHFGRPLAQVLRRLAHLARPGGEEPLFGLLEVNAAGWILHRSPLPAFTPPRAGAPCALLPIYEALSVPGRPLLRRFALAGGRSFHSLSIAEHDGPGSLNDTAPVSATMLFIGAEDAARTALAAADIAEREPRPVGIGCRLCTRQACAYRVETPVLAGI